jgi:hypothetical protein
VSGDGTVTLLDFLLARFDEEKAAGERALVWSIPNGFAWIGATPEAATVLAYSGHRLLAECEARRRIVKQLWAYVARPDPASSDPSGMQALWIVKTLAQPYSGHKDFQPEWLT